MRHSVAQLRQAAKSLRVLLWNAHRTPTVADQPLVTVIIATYNWSSVLRFAISSVLEQKYRNLELIVVGDGCTDDSAEVVGTFTDPRVRWVNLDRNHGNQSVPNNTGLSLASGTYVAYLGHDDLWRPNHLSHLVAAIQRLDADIVSAVCLAKGPPKSNLVRLTGGIPWGRSGDWVPPSSIMHRCDAIAVTGEWRDFREIEEPPDVHFVRQFTRCGLKHVRVTNLSVLKFNASWRPNSYKTQASAEQAECAERMQREHFFVERELAGVIRTRLRRSPEAYEQARERPAGVDSRGWLVSEWRRIRGLPPTPALLDEGQWGSSPPD